MISLYDIPHIISYMKISNISIYYNMCVRVRLCTSESPWVWNESDIIKSPFPLLEHPYTDLVKRIEKSMKNVMRKSIRKPIRKLINVHKTQIRSTSRLSRWEKPSKSTENPREREMFCSTISIKCKNEQHTVLMGPNGQISSSNRLRPRVFCVLVSLVTLFAKHPYHFLPPFFLISATRRFCNSNQHKSRTFTSCISPNLLSINSHRSN